MAPSKRPIKAPFMPVDWSSASWMVVMWFVVGEVWGPNGVPADRRHFNVHSCLRTRARERWRKLSIPRGAANLSVMTTPTQRALALSLPCPILLLAALGGCAGVSESNVHTAGKADAPADKAHASA